MKALVDADLAAATYTPRVILFNLGANDVVAIPAEATWKTNLAYILDAFNTKWPGAKVYLMRPWRRNYGAECNSLATWIADVISTRSTWASVGPDERVFLEGGDDGATYTYDGVHQNAAGATLTAAQWHAVIGY